MTAGAAIANAMDETRDLRLRTTLRRDDVHVATTWMPTYGFYLTELTAPFVVLERAGIDRLTEYTRTPEDARRAHQDACDRLERAVRS